LSFIDLENLKND